MKPVVAIGLALAVFAARTARAHDHWLQPDVLLAGDGGEVRVSHLVGEGFVKHEELGHEPGKAPRFSLYTGDAEPLDLRPRARPGTLPVVATFLERGAHLFVLDRAPVDLTLPPAQFESYLREEGFSSAIAERAKRGETASPGRERYVRCLKAFVRLGYVSDPAAGGRVVGQRLEIVPEHDPTDPTVSTIPVRVALHGVPLVAHPIEAHHRVGSKRTTLRLVTDESGRVALPLREGAYLLRAVHMERCLGCEGADWSSAFASYAFGRGPGTVRAPVLSAPVTMSTRSPRHRGLFLGLAFGLGIAALWTIRERRSLGASS